MTTYEGQLEHIIDMAHDDGVVDMNRVRELVQAHDWATRRPRAVIAEAGSAGSYWDPPIAPFIKADGRLDWPELARYAMLAEISDMIDDQLLDRKG